MTNLVILQPFNALYDGEHSYSYKVGEVHLVGSEYMPQWLHDQAVALGNGADTANPVSTVDSIDPSEIVTETQPDEHIF